MKFRITMKDPDGPYDCIEEAATAMVKAISGIEEEERQPLIEARKEKLSDFANKWMPYGEYLTVEFDTEAGTATVVKSGDK